MQSSQLYLFKRGSKYYIQYLDFNGKTRQVTTGCSQKSDAIQFLREHENDYTTEQKSKKLSDFMLEFSSYGKNIYSKSTYRSYSAALKHFLAFAGDTRLSIVTVRTADRFKSFRAQNVSPGSVNVDLRSLKTLFKLAKRWGYIGESPFSDIELMRSQRNDPKFLSAENYTALMVMIKEQWLKTVVQFAIFTGMRLGEIINLRWDQIYSDRKIILVENSSHFQTKNKRNRIVPISLPVLNVLEEMQGRRVGVYVFHNSGEKLCATYTSKKFKQYVKLNGFDDKFVFHNLRSTFASWMIMNGVDLFIISKLLGHSDVSVTAKHYANVHNEFLFKSINLLNLEKLPNNKLSK